MKEARRPRQQIERFPALDEEIFTSEERFEEYERHYLAVYAPPSFGMLGREVPSQSPLSACFLKFQEEMTRRKQNAPRDIAAPRVSQITGPKSWVVADGSVP
ncbi:MAG: hypothetical protein DMG85_07845 [Acidobacteria bacterium]|nr:MAG: hypothetical protein DMG85_07845 [Acidobacteriota bacterium]